MTTHEFGKQLLDGPNISIVVPKVLQYDDDEEDSFADPAIFITNGYKDEVFVETAIISYNSKRD